MDSTDNLNTQIFERSSDSFAEPSNESGSIIMYSIIFLGVLVLVAHYAGVNVFGYLGKGVDYIGDIVFPIWEKILGYFGQAALDDTKRVVNTSAKGTEAVADAVKATAEKVDDATAPEEESDDEGSEDVAPSDSTTTKGSSSKKAMGSQDYAASAAAVDGDDTINGESTALEKRVGASTLRNAIDSSQPTRSELDALREDSYKPNDIFTGSSKPNATGNKSGWCYIGNYSGYRSCSRVGKATECMSGDIFPSQDVCVNPNLRA